jgi:hypothetical protein
MKHTIEKMKNKLEYTEGKSVVSMTGYAFIDESGSCIIIVYGEGRRDAMSKYLNDIGDILNIKYKFVYL